MLSFSTSREKGLKMNIRIRDLMMGAVVYGAVAIYGGNDGVDLEKQCKKSDGMYMHTAENILKHKNTDFDLEVMEKFRNAAIGDCIGTGLRDKFTAAAYIGTFDMLIELKKGKK